MSEQRERDGEGTSGTAELEAEIARLDDRFKRALADLDNYRKRTAKDVDRRVTEGTDALLADWLDVADSVQRALMMTAGSMTGCGRWTSRSRRRSPAST